MAVLTRTEAVDRSALIDVTSYAVDLDLTQGEERFGSRSEIRFVCREPGAQTFLEVKAVEVRSITLNGNAIDPTTVTDGRVTLNNLQADNTVVVEATMAYSHDGEGLHRAVDPADGLVYTYVQAFLDAAPAVFACFDQPDLKAPFEVTVTAPPDWIVAGNGAATQEQPGHWRLATTRPLATYFFTICAGPYVSVTDEHDGIPLGVHARASLQDELVKHAPHMLQITKQSFDYYHRLFGIRYPWGEYHQFFVPEFNAGAMENPGCVVLRDQYVFRGAATRADVLLRSNTISHEMAHMWFGDLVTLKWWDDVWLNESFAEYMAHRCVSEATEFAEAWVDFGVARKHWGYGADRSPSTHPIAGTPAEDGNAALTNFDGISYAKGASALRQLAAYVGDEAFIAGVRDHLTKHSFGNATLADFLAAVSRASGKDLDRWATAWLRTPGTDTIAVRSGDGEQMSGVQIVRATPAQFPAERPHVLDVAGFTDGAQIWREGPFTLDSAAESLPDLDGKLRPKLLIPNASDLTWAIPSFDIATVEAMADQLGRVTDSQARQIAWSGLLNGMATSTVDPRVVLDVFTAAWPVETDESLRQILAARVPLGLEVFLPYAERESATAQLADAARRSLESSTGPQQVVAARLLAQTSAEEELLGRWASGRDLPPALEGDIDFRWAAMLRLAALGAADEARITELADEDGTMSGRQSTLGCLTARPTREAKDWAWDQLEHHTELSNYEALAIAGQLFVASDPDLVRRDVERYFTVIPALAGRYGEFAVKRIAMAAFPLTLTESAAVQAVHTALAADQEMTAGVRRALVDCAARLDEAMLSQQRFTTPAKRQ
ncbi:aminopeptidase N [Calidifontibacter sp. DB0510]|uniref:Aminopeptidase N n=1 Tax=Metallococcus carri TaxID=1656884 RepID=A0A967E8H9_9MICO|nr:aminopeptidase N [Metallococcus carri]NHN55232.1 aminopeptidase N [Metallococcus carri]NOP36309.1 aminopeptidase N [Calidifontibacter sp. DB2511S]